MRRLSDAEKERLVAVQRVIQHAVTTPGGREDIARAQQEGYASLAVDPRDGAALKAADTRRIHVYRGLVRSTIRGGIKAQLELTVAHLGEEHFERTLDAFCSTELPRSRLFRDVPYELARWACPRWRDDPALPPWIADLARWELLEFDVYTAERQSRDDVLDSEPTADQSIAFDGSARLGRFDWTVHQIEGSEEPTSKKVALLCYRDNDGDLRKMDLTPIALSLLEALMFEGMALAEAVQTACAANDHPIDQKVIDGTSQVLEDLSHRGVVLGVRPAGHPTPPSPFARWLIG